MTKVTKHIPPQTSPVGSTLAGIWSTVSRFLCRTLYYNLYHKASGNFLPEGEKIICIQGLYYSLYDKKDFVLQYVKQLENENLSLQVFVA